MAASERQATSFKKYAALAVVFAAWLGGDLWTKHWADTTLANPHHPVPIHVGPEDAGRTVAELAADVVGADAEDIQGYLVRLPSARALSPDHAVFDRRGESGDAHGYYTFWRSDGALPPRRMNKNEHILIERWLRAAVPSADATRVREVVAEHLSSVTLASWLQQRVRRLGDDRLPEVAAERMHPITGPLEGVAPDAAAVAGETYLLEWYRVDVMGDWFKLLYAENPGAAFGFLRGLPARVRDGVFFTLTIIVFLVILGIIARTETRHWMVLLALTSVLGGAMGNFVDRIRYGYVIDFIDMHLGFMHWPTYNVADVAIAVGVGLLLLDVLFNKESPLA